MTQVSIAKLLRPSAAAVALILLAGCTPQNVKDEKNLRTQLAHEISHHSYESAIPIARRIIRTAPQDNRIWKKLVQAQIGLHDFEGARETLTNWRATVKPTFPRVDEFEGDIAREEYRFEDALQEWDKAAANQPKNHRVLQKIAGLEQEQRHWPQAIAAWDRSIAIKDNAVARINRAVCHRCLRHWQEAFDDLHRAQELGPDDPEVKRWSRLFENLSAYVDQIREFDARVAALHDDPGLLGDRALLLLRSGDPELALDDSDHALKIEPAAMRPRLFKAIALIGLGRARECDRLSVRQPLRLDSLTPEFLETISRIDAAISVERDNADNFAERAWQLNEIGQPLLALEDAQTALRLDAKSGSALAECGYALMKLGHSQQALESIRQATTLQPTLATAWQYRGEIEMSRGDTTAAVDSLTRSINIQQTAVAYQKREECYRQLGYKARADDDHRAWQQLTSRTLR